MFDLISGELQHAPRYQTAPFVASVAAHAVVAGAILLTTVFLVGERLPEVRTMMAFVAAPALPVAPPPPTPVPAAARARREQARPTPTSSPAAPLAAPIEMLAEVAAPDPDEEGYTTGVEGGLPGGVAGGVLGTLDIDIPLPPPPPPPPPGPHAPIRVGGDIREPALVHRVDPVYPALAVSAGLEGTVILEAIVDRDGQVESVRVIRSRGVLDRAAREAVQQWRYSPVLLNGRPERFILTVVVSFRIEDK